MYFPEESVDPAFLGRQEIALWWWKPVLTRVLRIKILQAQQISAH